LAKGRKEIQDADIDYSNFYFTYNDSHPITELLYSNMDI
jgi:hypothetical protein